MRVRVKNNAGRLQRGEGAKRENQRGVSIAAGPMRTRPAAVLRDDAVYGFHIAARHRKPCTASVRDNPSHVAPRPLSSAQRRPEEQSEQQPRDRRRAPAPVYTHDGLRRGNREESRARGAFFPLLLNPMRTDAIRFGHTVATRPHPWRLGCMARRLLCQGLDRPFPRGERPRSLR